MSQEQKPKCFGKNYGTPLAVFKDCKDCFWDFWCSMKCDGEVEKE